MFIKVTPAWKRGAGIGVRVSGVWKPVTSGWVNVQGVWKPFEVSPPSIRLAGTSQESSVQNRYHYETVSQAQVVVASGDRLQFEVYLGPDTRTGSMEGHFTRPGGGIELMRDNSLGIKDQNNFRLHPATFIDSLALAQWYARDFDISVIAGATIDLWAVVIEDDALGDHSAYFRNIKVVDVNGAVKLTIFSDTLTVPGLSTFIATSNGYANISKAVVPSP